MLDVLTDVERSCLDRYIAHLEVEFGDELAEVWVFGPVARGEAWPAGMHISSDLDLCVTQRELTQQEKDALLDATYPLFPECGRQISPAIVEAGKLPKPLAAAIAADGICLR